ncbi:hypothetical protein [Shouchella clausii]|uniref:Uncharacterized protein n=1 Tax=Shouchella clausii TaxID=79880 RepID=A0A268NW65_SHOCL|nr:hypothetical protein [Shouchella clausii]PAE87726.1 hypothetical protein CHH72_16955 [Shouchella clausii]PAF27342.1 hypothetical protein CHH61_03725 [Shouchella clausii]
MFGVSTVELLAGSGGWDLRNFLKNSFSTLGDWISLAVMILGIIAVGYAVWQIVSGLMSQGKKQTNWAVAITLLLVGGVLSMTTGFQFVQDIARGGRKTIEDLGGQTITLFYFAKTFLP